MLGPTSYDYTRIVSDIMDGDRDENANLAYGFIAGAIGGLVGTALKTVAEKYFPPRDEDDTTPPAILANEAKEAITGDHLTDTEEQVAESSIHWLFGSLIGGAYGAAVELSPVFKEGAGLPFGTAVFGLMHEGLLPALGVEAPHAEKDDEQESNELITHLIYGFTTEVVRNIVRGRLG